MSKDWYEDIKEFHMEFGHHIGRIPKIPPMKIFKLRYSLIEEEMRETLDALFIDDLEGIADGICDSIVVLLGTAISYGIDIRRIWNEVHKSNMAKIGGGKREDCKSLKPEGWEPPNIKELLEEQRNAR